MSNKKIARFLLVAMIFTNVIGPIKVSADEILNWDESGVETDLEDDSVREEMEDIEEITNEENVVSEEDEKLEEDLENEESEIEKNVDTNLEDELNSLIYSERLQVYMAMDKGELDTAIKEKLVEGEKAVDELVNVWDQGEKAKIEKILKEIKDMIDLQNESINKDKNLTAYRNLELKYFAKANKEKFRQEISKETQKLREIDKDDYLKMITEVKKVEDHIKLLDDPNDKWLVDNLRQEVAIILRDKYNQEDIISVINNITSSIESEFDKKPVDREKILEEIEILEVLVDIEYDTSSSKKEHIEKIKEFKDKLANLGEDNKEEELLINSLDEIRKKLESKEILEDSVDNQKNKLDKLKSQNQELYETHKERFEELYEDIEFKKEIFRIEDEVKKVSKETEDSELQKIIDEIMEIKNKVDKQKLDETKYKHKENNLNKLLDLKKQVEDLMDEKEKVIKNIKDELDRIREELNVEDIESEKLDVLKEDLDSIKKKIEENNMVARFKSRVDELEEDIGIKVKIIEFKNDLKRFIEEKDFEEIEKLSVEVSNEIVRIEYQKLGSDPDTGDRHKEYNKKNILGIRDAINTAFELKKIEDALSFENITENKVDILIEKLNSIENKGVFSEEIDVIKNELLKDTNYKKEIFELISRGREAKKEEEIQKVIEDIQNEIDKIGKNQELEPHKDNNIKRLEDLKGRLEIVIEDLEKTNNFRDRLGKIREALGKKEITLDKVEDLEKELEVVTKEIKDEGKEELFRIKVGELEEDIQIKLSIFNLDSRIEVLNKDSSNLAIHKITIEIGKLKEEIIDQQLQNPHKENNLENLETLEEKLNKKMVEIEIERIRDELEKNKEKLANKEIDKDGVKIVVSDLSYIKNRIDKLPEREDKNKLNEIYTELDEDISIKENIFTLNDSLPELKDKSKTIEERKEAIRKLKEDIESLKEDIKLQNLEPHKRNNLENLNKIEDELESIEKELMTEEKEKEIEEKLKEIEKEVEAIDDKTTEEKLEEIEKDIEDLEKEIEELGEDSKSKEEFEDRLEKAKIKLALEKIKKALANKDISKNRVNQLDKELQEIKEKIDLQDDDFKVSVKDRVGELDKDIEIKEEIFTIIDESREILENLSGKDIKEILSEIEKVEDKIKVLEDKINREQKMEPHKPNNLENLEAIKSKLDELKKQIEDLEEIEEISDIMDRLVEIKDILEEGKDNHKDISKAELDRTKDKLNKIKDEVKEKGYEKIFGKMIGELEEDITIKEKIFELQDELSKLDIENSIEELKEFKGKVEALEVEITNQKLTKPNMHHDKNMDKADKLMKEIDKLITEKEIQIEKEEKEKEIGEKLEEIEKEVEGIDDKTTEEKLEEIEKDIEDLEKEIEELGEDSKSKEEFEDRLEKAKIKLALEKIKKSLANKDISKNRVNQLDKELEEIKGKIESQDDEFKANVKDRVEELNKDIEIKEEIFTIIDESREILENLSGKDSEKVLSEIEKVEKKIEELTAKINKEQNMQPHKQNNLENLKSIKSKLDELKKQIEDLEEIEEISDIMDRLVEIKDILEEGKDNHKDISKAELDTTKEKLYKIKSELEGKSYQEIFGKMIGELEEDITIKEKIFELQDELSKLDIENSIEELKEFKGKVEALEVEITNQKLTKPNMHHDNNMEKADKLMKEIDKIIKEKEDSEGKEPEVPEGNGNEGGSGGNTEQPILPEIPESGGKPGEGSGNKPGKPSPEEIEKEIEEIEKEIEEIEKGIEDLDDKEKEDIEDLEKDLEEIQKEIENLEDGSEKDKLKDKIKELEKDLAISKEIIYHRSNHIKYIEGDENGLVRPEEDVTREEVAATIYRIVIYKDKYITTESRFKDVENNRWSNKYIATLENMDLLKGYEDGEFKPGNKMTRGEFAKIIYDIRGLKEVDREFFKDTKNHWSKKYINGVASKNWIQGYEDGSFRPDEYMTRAEMISIINNMLGRKDSIGETEIQYDYKDLSKDKWYYKEIIEASNGHQLKK